MSDLLAGLSPTERREIDHLAAQHTQSIGLCETVSAHDMALALISAHLVLIRDCGDILPGKGRGAKLAGPRRIRGKGGVSLGGGC